eukprot:SAG31_NODE_1090_length_9967_cov_66.880726_5_plen_69_part_00
MLSPVQDVPGHGADDEVVADKWRRIYFIIPKLKIIVEYPEIFAVPTLGVWCDTHPDQLDRTSLSRGQA